MICLDCSKSFQTPPLGSFEAIRCEPCAVRFVEVRFGLVRK